MNDPVIRAEHLGKMYRIGLPPSRPANAWQAARQVALAPFAYIREIGRPPSEAETLWAMRDISFAVNQGEIVGVVGSNGAGKSTLLKVLCRITKPSEGRAQIYGRIGSLLEVGTGFHPELTGRENIYLNGNILGMKNAEVRRKFDEIVAFSEVEQFLDTPVKRYSSGMHVRLAFAVAAHLDPEILLIDEVLAVGDAAFQRKCLGKMSDIANDGRTILFVSHNMAAVANLCTRAILLQKGRLLMEGTPDDVIRTYLAQGESGGCWHVDTNKLGGDGPVRIDHIEVLDAHDQTLQDLPVGGSLKLRLHYSVADGKTMPSVRLGIRVKSQMGMEVLRLSNDPTSGFPLHNLSGRGTLDVVLPILPLLAGDYWVDIAVARLRQGRYLELNDVLSFSVRNHDIYASGSFPGRGMIVVPHRWIHRREQGAVEDSGWVGPALFGPAQPLIEPAS